MKALADNVCREWSCTNKRWYCNPVSLAALSWILLFAFVLTAEGATFFDDFNDGNDTSPAPAWEKFDPIGVGDFSFPNGNSYRLRSGASPDPGNYGPGRAGSVQPGSYTNFYVSADVVAWDESIHQVFGVMARLESIGAGTTTGYLFTHDRGNPASSTSGDMDIVRIDGESPTSLPTTGSDSIHFEPGKTYRLTFSGIGDQFIGQVYELPDTSTPIVSITATDSNYTEGQSGLLVANNSTDSGYDGPADATFDSFLATTAEPRLSVSVSGGTIQLSWPLIPFTLQSTPSLNSPAWSRITTGITQAGDQNVYGLPATGNSQFFRLVYP